MARRSFANFNSRKVTWLIIALVLIAISIALRWPTIALTTIPPLSTVLLWSLFGLHACIGFLWFRLSPLQSKIIIALAAVLWPAFDQLVVMFHRYVGGEPLFELPEFAAAELGIWLGWCVCWFIKPYAGVAVKSRREFCKFAVFHALRQKRNFNGIFFRMVLPAICSAFLVSIIPFALDVLIYEVTATQSSFTERMIYTRPLIFASIGGLAGFAIGVSLVWRWAVTKRSKEHQETKPCFKCGESCLEVVFNASGWGACGSCSKPIHKGQWIAPPRLMAMSIKQRSRMQFAILRALAAGVLFAVLVFVLAFALEIFVIDLFAGMHLALIIYFILVFRCMRIEVARRYDLQHIECRECGYELKGIPIAEGVGTCPECGLQFAKFV